MGDSNPLDQVRALIKAYRGPADATFATAYRKTIDGFARAGQLTAAEVESLDKLRGVLDDWYRAPTADKGEGDWVSIVEASLDRLPVRVFETILSRMPAGIVKDMDLAKLVLERADKRLLTLLVGSRVIKATHLIRVAKNNPEAFSQSPALDVLLEAGGCPPRTVWEHLANSAGRPLGLKPTPEAVSDAYAVDVGGDASRWFVAFLGAHAELRSATLQQLFRDPPALAKLLAYIGSEDRGLKGKKREQAKADLASVAGDLVALSIEAVESGRRTARIAVWLVGVLALGAHSPTSTRYRELTNVIDDGLNRVYGPRVLAALRDEGKHSSGEELPLVISTKHLHQAVQDYLAHLPTGAGPDGQQPERAARFQRFLGRKEVVQEILPLLQTDAVPAVSRGALDAALFNVGLRPLGVSQGDDTFDHRIHEPDASGIVPGDHVTVVAPGWQLGDDGTVVLTKARVVPRD